MRMRTTNELVSIKLKYNPLLCAFLRVQSLQVFANNNVIADQPGSMLDHLSCASVDQIFLDQEFTRNGHHGQCQTII